AAASALTADEAAALVQLMRALDPGHAPAVLIHLDFCTENMVVDAHGALRVIDNEQLEIAAAGLDLARTFCRWPMPDAAWERFGARVPHRGSGAAGRRPLLAHRRRGGRRARVPVARPITARPAARRAAPLRHRPVDGL